MSKYVIQFMGSVNSPKPTNFCMGVAAPGINAPVNLSNLSFGSNTEWVADPVAGTITSAADSTLVLSFTGTSPSNGTPLVLQQQVPGGLNQQWNWSGNSPRIVSVNFPTFAIDDNLCSSTPGTPLQMFSTGGGCQAWRFITVAQAQAFAKESAEQ